MKYLLLLVMVLCTSLGDAQTQKIGLQNKKHEPLINASVIGIDDDSFAMTDSEGKVLVAVGKKYKFSFVGYYDTILVVKSNDTLLILTSRIAQLDDVVVKAPSSYKQFKLLYAEKSWKTYPLSVARSQEVFRFKPRISDGLCKISAIEFQIKNHQQLPKNNCVMVFRAFCVTKTKELVELTKTPLLFNLDTATRNNKLSVLANSIYIRMQEVDYLLFSLVIPFTSNPKPVFDYYQVPKKDTTCNALKTGLDIPIDEAIQRMNNHETIYFKDLGGFTAGYIYFPKLNIQMVKYVP